MKKRLSLGALYGTGLAALSYRAAGAGHGAYCVLGLVSAPMGFLGVLAALITLPFLWTAVFALREKKMFLTAMLLHYSGAALLLTMPLFADNFGDWDHLARTWEASSALLVLCFLWYLAGQVFLWINFAASKANP